MDSKRIEELLKKYWECETSLEEEQMLRDYFISDTSAEQFRDASTLFRYFEQQKKKSLHDTFIDDVAIKRLKKNSEGRQVNLIRNSLRIAAGIVVLMTAIWFVRSEIRKTTPAEMIDTYDDPQLAFEETKKALLMISKSFGTAEEQVKKVNLFNEAQEQIERKNENHN